MLSILDRYLMRQLLPVFLLTAAGLTVILSIAEMFSYMHLLTDRQIPLSEIGMLLLLYLPQAFIYALPVSLLFSICLTLASLYANNELIAILNSGVSFWRLTRTVIAIGVIACIGSLLFQEMVQIPSSAARERQIDALIGRPVSLDNRNIALWDQSATVLYFAERYLERQQQIRNVTIIIFEGRTPVRRIDAALGEFSPDEEAWMLSDVRKYHLEGEHTMITYLPQWTDPAVSEPPEHFRRQESKVEHMRFNEALIHIQRLAFIDQQLMREAMTDLYGRIMFSFIPLIVTLLSVSVGSKLKKNILLLSLFFSLGISVIYYIYEFIFHILARQGYLHPLTGSLLPFMTFFILSLILYRQART